MIDGWFLTACVTEEITGYRSSYRYDPATETLHADVQYTMAMPPPEYIEFSFSVPDS
jgi:hypothetical protein